ncbi:Transcription initiation factor TFIID subunit 5 [Actinomortierella ambigua]|uniref:Transcription initiation factor TFIID subunit 5 n=1 Tax=Actinomortierella ambigua TaxID=1343610 RepID=A0A9P6QLJ9_9FUNG|nr:Transcription initiation factor TFIID subunit 5 [Actinomortierella ambigua]
MASSGSGTAGASGSAQGQTGSTTAPPPPAAPQTQQEVDRIVLNYLNQKGYKHAEYMLKHEAKILSLEEMAATFNPAESDGTVPGFVMLYDRSDMGNPEAYDIAYSAMRRWVGNSLDFYKPELMSVLFPLFVHSYLNLVSKDLKENARKFMESYRADHMELHAQDMARLATITDAQQAKENELAQMYRTNKYHVRLSQVSFELLIAFLQDNKFMVLLRIVNQHLNIQVTAANQSKTSQDEDVIGITGHGSNQLTTFNQQKVLLGAMPMDPGFQTQVEQTLKEEEARSINDNAMNGEVQPTTLLDDFKKVKTEAGVDSPSRDDIPLPPLKGSDIQAEIELLRDLRKRVSLGPGALPSICAYTFHNTNDNMNCVAVSQDTTFMAAGFSESYVRLWSLKGEKLRGMRSNFNPATINDSSDLNRLKEKSGSESKRLIGHSGPVFGASFSPDNKYLITCSEDKTARLWSTNTFTNLVCYKGHNYPVWDVEFGPLGFYFATASHDRTARLWSCDHIYPLRIFAGHLSDVDVVKFHPNSKYLVTGSSDKTSRLWDVQRGTCVRVFTGHAGAINALAVSPDGRLMASAGDDRTIQLWDLGSGKRLKKMTGHQGIVYSLDFSADGHVLVSGGSDCTVRTWDVKKDTTTPLSTVSTAAAAATAVGGGGTSVGGTANGLASSSSILSPTAATAAESGKHKKLNGHGSSSSISSISGAGAAGSGAAATSIHHGAGVIESEDHLACFATKRTPIYKVQFTKRNLCLAVGAFSG